MKILKLSFLLLSVFITSLTATPSYSHVVPEDQLRNQVYLTTRQALQKVFAGIHKIKKEKRKISPSEQLQIEKLLQRKIDDPRIEFFTAQNESGKLYASIGKAYANSHPVTKARFVVLIDSKGQIKDLHIMEYRGPQRAEIISRNFLGQFLGKSAESDFTAVTSNQGPTPSIQALKQAVQEILVTYNTLYLDAKN